MSNFDRFETPHDKRAFPDPNDKEVVEYSTCSGCDEVITTLDVATGWILDIYGMCVHDNSECVKKAVEAKTVTLDIL